ncbi:hypothetical protein [Nevskia sp.]|uniref:hypothetical protein n=1 Tax=Nevskia sp. TaxID=1929292 RepID=UPI002600B5DC|nr:hypothetical protein [Nevskia sp.]
MHTLLVIAGGSVLLGVFVMFGILWGGGAVGIKAAAIAFIPLWLAISVTNLWIGVARAGYAVHEELPILAVVFAVPTAIAVFTAWRS